MGLGGGVKRLPHKNQDKVVTKTWTRMGTLPTGVILMFNKFSIFNYKIKYDNLSFKF